MAKKSKKARVAKAKASAPAPVAKTNDPLAGVLDAWKAGEQIFAIAKRLNVKRSKIRRALIGAAGGKDAFKALRQQGAGGTVEPFGGKRAEPRTREKIALDDAAVTTLTRERMRLDGWRHEWLRTPLGSEPILVNHDGTQRYVRANATERADILVDPATPGVASWRGKLLNEAALARHVKKAEAEVERGEALIEKTRARKRSAKLARKAKAGSASPSSEEN